MNKLMKRIVMLAVVGMMAAGGIVGQVQAEELRVATYNVENMFDVFNDPYTQDEGTDVKFREELEQIAETLRVMNADVVVFSEVENEFVLKALVKEFLPDMGYDYVSAMRANDGRGIRNGVISLKPIVKATSYKWRTFTLPGYDKVYRFSRDLMHVTIQATDEKVVEVFGVHLKSKRDSSGDPKSAKRRLAEALEAKKIIDGVMNQSSDSWVVMAGDFNDTLDSAVMKSLLKDGKLKDMHEGMGKEERVTYLHGPYRSTIDFVLASDALAKRKVKGSELVLHDEELNKASDHAPVAVSFDLD
ncbi:Endonuclease/Exonuclease/phosphatase family protein [Poriferisphaera corsica]|uniref:Endonuclease/Exonuclease/phosphatase family protein n=1 Tax=Poriferisphaera corsica TaxID=2528020 RepID=A0A517YTQ8_9BACT|nr:endonuclease/exonuclease/phosphatase family protein [Poriferisphaera corsica]QDU33614.1 Endonuclease/Exonuclease/phosphatase family protein [Poriferisphaera corsica]